MPLTGVTTTLTGVMNVVDVEGGESDGTTKNTETELSMRMFCKYYCCKYEKAGSFVVGSPAFKLESIKAHNSSAMKRALREKAENNPTMDQLGKATFDKLFFRNAHAIARHSRPYTDLLAYWQHIQKRQAVCNVYPAHFSVTKAWNQRDGCRGKVCVPHLRWFNWQQPHQGRTGICSALSPRVNHCPLCWGETYYEGGCPSDRSGNVNSLHRLLCWPLVGKEDCGNWNWWRKHRVGEKQWICGETATTAIPNRTCRCSLLCTLKWTCLQGSCSRDTAVQESWCFIFTSSIGTAPSSKLLMRSERPTVFWVDSAGHVGFPTYQEQFPMCWRETRGLWPIYPKWCTPMYMEGQQSSAQRQRITTLCYIPRMSCSSSTSSQM